MNTIIFFAYRISNCAGNRSLYCTDIQVFGGKLVKIHPHIVEFLFHVRLYIPWVSSYGGVWSLQGSSLSAYQLNLIFFVARHVIESLLHKDETLQIISSKEVSQ